MGSAQNPNCGCGAWLRISPTCHYKLYWYGGSGTNTRAEVIALWGLMWFTNHLRYDRIFIYGDSKVLIDHLLRKATINQNCMSSWLNRIDFQRKKFSSISFRHIYRERNSQADCLSKNGLQGRFGEINYEFIDEEGRGAKGSVLFAEFLLCFLKVGKPLSFFLSVLFWTIS